MLGGLGKIGEITKLMKHAKDMQEEIANSRYEADSGAGAVTATVTGRMELVDLKISPETVASGDVEMLEDLVKSAVGAAQRKASEGARAKMQELTGGLPLPPGIDKLMGGGQ